MGMEKQKLLFRIPVSKETTVVMAYENVSGKFSVEDWKALAKYIKVALKVEAREADPAERPTTGERSGIKNQP
jgi:hypothetical protein